MQPQELMGSEKSCGLAKQAGEFRGRDLPPKREVTVVSLLSYSPALGRSPAGREPAGQHLPSRSRDLLLLRTSLLQLLSLQTCSNLESQKMVPMYGL